MGARLIRDRDRDADSARLGARRPTRTPAHSRLYRLSALCPLFERQSRQVVNVACMSSIKGLVESFHHRLDRQNIYAAFGRHTSPGYDDRVSAHATMHTRDGRPAPTAQLVSVP